MNAEQETKARWGRSRFGGSQALLIIVSLLGGVVLSLGVGAIFARMKYPEDFALAMLVAAAAFLPVLSVICWALLIDRETLRGAIKNPEISVESQWYDKAAVAVFQDLILFCGLVGGVLSFIGTSAEIGLVLIAVLVLAMADFGVRYLLIKRAEG